MINELFADTVVISHHEKLYRAFHLLCYRTIEVQGVRLRARRLASFATCMRLPYVSLQLIFTAKPVID